jgi:hypothetical protein
LDKKAAEGRRKLHNQMGQKIKAYKIFIKKTEGMTPLELSVKRLGTNTFTYICMSAPDL